MEQQASSGDGRVNLKDLNINDSSLIIDDFVLLKVIGTGSYGKVILSKKKDTGEVYAIKTLKKKHLIKKNQVEHTIAERSILEHIVHPFIIKLAFAFQTKSKLYFVLEFCPGGELFFHLSRIGNFDEKILKPENVLIDKDGYAKLTDFGLSKENIKGNSDAKTLCGTPEYLAPEIVDRKGHGRAVDWWSVGAIIYEMLTGQPPFTLNNNNREELFDNIRNCRVQIPDHLTPQCKDLLDRLFVADPEKRLGGGPGDGQEIKNHPWFAGVDWRLIETKQIKPPFKPKLASETDVRYIDNTFTTQELHDSPESMAENSLNSLKAGMWDGFSYGGK